MNELLTCIQASPGILLWIGGAIASAFTAGFAAGVKWQDRDVKHLERQLSEAKDRIRELAEETQTAQGARARDIQEYWMQSMRVGIAKAEQEAQAQLTTVTDQVRDLTQQLEQRSEEHAAIKSRLDSATQERERLRATAAVLTDLRRRADHLGEEIDSRITQQARAKIEKEEREAPNRILIFIAPGDHTERIPEIEAAVISRVGPEMEGSVLSAVYHDDYRNGSTLIRVRGAEWERYVQEHLGPEGWLHVPPAEVRDLVSGAISQWTRDFHRYFMSHPHEGPSISMAVGSSGICEMTFHEDFTVAVRLALIATATDIGVAPAAKYFRGLTQQVEREAAVWIEANALKPRSKAPPGT